MLLSITMMLSLMPQNLSIAMEKEGTEENGASEVIANVVPPSEVEASDSDEQPQPELSIGGEQLDENTHAYDPMEEIREKQAEEEFRESAEIIKKTVLFSVREEMEEGETPVYLDDESELCSDHSLTDVELIFDTQHENGEWEVFYEAKTAASDVWSVVDEMNEDDRIANAEPDYVWETMVVSDYKVSDNEYNYSSVQYGDMDVKNAWNEVKSSTGDAPGAGTVVAVIDTGVDYNHVDLKKNMWKNSGEIPDNGVDDDGNGYVDDVYGYNFVANNGDPMDDMGHGTHVAGIIGMSNNKKGGVGIAFGTKIMAVKAGQATGSFSNSDVAKAIKYAQVNGADVINMSFGGTATSYLIEQALRDASNDCVLVAAAGNNGYPTTDAIDYIPQVVDHYPSGYSYVLGVMATDYNGNFASFSNWDYKEGQNCEYEIAATGVSIYSTIPGNRYANWSGTSMSSPAVAAAAAILRSKYPDKNVYTSRFINGQLVSATTRSTIKIGKEEDKHIYPLLNINDSLTKTPTPNVVLNDFYMFDDESISPNNNGDGIAQPGEIIDLGVGVFNYWGTGKDVTISIDTLSQGGVQNPYVEIITDSVNIGEVGMFTTSNNGFTYTDGALTGVSNPLRIKIKEGTPNDIQIPINFTVTCKNGMDSSDKTIYNAYGDIKPTYTLIVQNGYALSGVINEDMTLTNDKYWIIQNNVLIPEGVTVTVEPGTQIQFWSADPANPYAKIQDVYIQVEGRFIAEGTEEKPIEIFPADNYDSAWVTISGTNINYDHDIGILDNDYSKSYVELKYVNMINAGSRPRIGNIYEKYFCATVIDHCHLIIDQEYDVGNRIYSRQMSNSIFENYGLHGYSYGYFKTINIDRCLFQNSKLNLSNDYSGYEGELNRRLTNSVFQQCHNNEINDYMYLYKRAEDDCIDDIMANYGLNNNEIGNSDNTPIFSNNALLSQITLYHNVYLRIISAQNSHNTYDISGNYWGTTNPDLVKIQCYDQDWNVSLDQLVQEPYLTLEDDMSEIYPFVTEAYLTDADGNRIDTVSGKQQVSLHVKFNRDMAQDIQPMVTYGGSDPYTDYMPSGDWVAPREWRADFTITPDYEMGRMYIRVKGAAAADDRWLVTGEDAARFFFEVTNNSAQSMTLQGEGQLGQNSLSWIQDDYETLAGYNVYRSTSYDNSKDPATQKFTRVNTSILSGEELSYIDDTVEPSVPYYYYFTVIDTDMKESKASNVVECTALEGEPPVITHTPVTSCNKGDNVLLTASITDNAAVESAKLHYRYGTASWTSATMQNTTGSNYRATINANKKADIQYYITAVDESGNIGFFGTEEEPYTITCRYLDHIEVTQLPDKLTYLIGEDFDSTGLVVSAVYNDNTKEEISPDDYEIWFNGEDGFDSSEEGTVTVEVDYSFETADFEVIVSEKAEPQTATITFNTDGGTEIPPITQGIGTPVTAPADPEKEGFVFAGWDTPIPTNMPSMNITVTALWEEQIDISTGELIIDPITFNYTGNEKRVIEAIVKLGDQILDPECYDVEGNTGTKPGKYVLTVTGKGKYTGTLSAQWKISKMYKLTTIINGETNTLMCEDNELITAEGEGSGGWFVNGILESVKNRYSFYLNSDTTIEWRTGEEFDGVKGIANMYISDRTVDGTRTNVIVTAKWSVPAGSVIIHAGTYKLYVDADQATPDQETMINSGSYTESGLEFQNGTYYYTVGMGPVSAARKLCMMTYVLFELDGETYTITSDVVTSCP